MPIYRLDKFKNGSALAVWEITETEEQLLQLCSVPNNELEDLQYMSNPDRRRERLAVRVLLDQLLDEKAYVGYHENGRPYLQNDSADISIAHTKRFACIYYNPEVNVGVDIECLSRNFSAVEKKALSEEESEYLSDTQRNIQLCIIWCAKEAIFKVMSSTGIDFVKQIMVERFTPRKKGKLSATFTTSEGIVSELELSYRILDDHALVWVGV